MNPVIAHLIIGGVPILAAIAGGWIARRSRAGGWILFAVISLLWASVIVPFPDGNPIGTREEWFRRLRMVSAVPVGILIGIILLPLIAHRRGASAE